MRSLRDRLSNIDPVMLSRVLFLSVVGLALFFGGTTVYLSNKLHKLQPSKAVLAEKMKKNPLTVIDQVGDLMELPKGEDPVIATVTDPNKLEDQQFFKNAQKGDKVIVYPKSKLAILFRPSTNKIIQAGPGIYQSSTPTPQPTQAATPTPTTEVVVPQTRTNVVVPSAAPSTEVSAAPSPAQ